MNDDNQALRKAAILIDSLDPQAASLLFENLPPEYAAGVRETLQQLGDIDLEERARVVREFQHLQAAPPFPVTDGVELSEPLAKKLTSYEDLEPQECDPAESPRTDAPAPGPFAFLDKTPTEFLVRSLAPELPQTMCVVLAHLPPWRAAEVLACLADGRRAEVLQRLSHLEQVDPAVVAEVEQGLRQTLAASSCETANRPVGRAVIEAILQAAGDEQRQALLEHLDPDDLRSPPSGPVLPPPSPLRADEDLLAGRTTCDGAQQLLRLLAEPTSDRAAPSSGDGRDPASDLTDNVLAFGDFLTLDDSALAKIFRAADAQITLLALCGASRELIDRIARRLPPRESRALGRKLEALGPTRLSDIESAQRHLAELASQMADAGQIQVPGFRRFTVAV